jgi:hypothetical protein
MTDKATHIRSMVRALIDKTLRVHRMERAANKRARYHVYYRHNGKVRFYPLWNETPQSAMSAFQGFVKEFRMHNVEFLRLQSLTPTFP